MNLVNNYAMKYSKCENNYSGVYYCTRRVLKFQLNEEVLGDDDLFNLLCGVIRLVKRTAELHIENKYKKEIATLKNTIKRLTLLKNISQ